MGHYLQRPRSNGSDSDALQSFRDLDTIAIVAHGNSGGLSLANQYIDAQRLLEQREMLSQWGDHLSDSADILLFSCDVAQGERGGSFIHLLSQLSGTDVAASVDRTGSSTLGANWNLERSTGPVSIDATLVDSIEGQVAGLLPITIFAAGETGQEEMELRIDGQVVATWNNIGGQIYAGVFQTFTYDGPTAGLTPERIRVAFTNDLFVEGLSDRNLRVDRIVVDGTTFETEAPTVYSTGTWKQEDGIVPGFRQSEFLQSDGYFQYAVVNNGSIIEVYASGQVGPEAMTLRIDDKDVASWTGVGAGALTGTFSKFTYQASGSILPSQVKLAFTNDLYSPPTDYNLRVDRIVIDGVSYQTEAPTVYSTGTYVAAQNGIVAGYPQSEWLHSKGYFQYGAKSLNPGYLGLESSVYTVNEGNGSVSIAVVRTFGKDGEVSIDYKTASGTATSPADFTATSGTLRFADGEVRKTIVIPIINDTVKEPPEGFNLVIENPKGGATLLAPRTATATIQDNDLILPNYTSFPNATGLKLNGNASIASGTLQLTPNSANRRGSAFYTTPIPLLSSTSFQTQFVSKTTGTTNGGEGFTFVIQNAASGTSSLGTGGSSLGYAGIAKSLAIEFDTNANAGELNNNHVSIWRDGSMVTSLATSAVTVDFNSGTNVYTWIDYYGDSDQLSLFVSNTTTKPTTPITTLPLDLFGIVGTQAYFGFSAATGSLTNAHQIVSWNLNLNRPASPAIVPAANLVSETVISGLTQPIAVEFSSDGRNTYVAQKAGQVVVVRDGVTLTSPFIDISGQVNNHDDRGLLDIALHPDFPNTPYLYLLYTYDPPQVYQNLNDELAGPDKGGNRVGRLIRVTADAATNYTTAVAGSEVVLLGTNSTWANFNAYIDSTVNITEPPGGTFLDGTYVQDFINSDSSSHTVASLMFGVDGALYVSIGDGASYNTMDPRAVRVQDIDNLSGKLLRIDPLTGLGYPNNPTKMETFRAIVPRSISLDCAIRFAWPPTRTMERSTLEMWVGPNGKRSTQEPRGLTSVGRISKGATE